MSAVSLPLGAMLGLWLKPGRKFGSTCTAFGAGALLFALTIELFGHVPHYVEEHGPSAFVATLIGAISGGLIFDVLNQYLNNKGAFLRRLSNARRHIIHTRLSRTGKLIDELSRVEILGQLPADAMAQLIRKVREGRVKKGEAIFRQGDTGQELYFIVSGSVEITAQEEDGAKRLVARLGAHEIFGEIGLLHDVPRTADAIAATDLHIYKLLRSDFEGILATVPKVRGAIEALAETRLSGLSAKKPGKPDRDWKKAVMTDVAPAAQDVSMEDIMDAAKTPGAAGAAMAIWLGILIDGVPESFVIGMLAVSATGISLSFIAGVFLANLPEAMSSAVSMAASGMSRTKIMLMWGSICVMTGAGAFIGAMVIPANPEGAMFYGVLFIEALAAGAMLTMIAETMLPEAFEHGGAIVGLSTLAGFLTTLFVKIL